MMRAVWLVAASLALAVIVQVSVLNGLLLPGGGVPDLVLVLVCALAMASGPVNGIVIGFAAGLSLDLAPPGSELVGQYALVFCLAGWAAGRLRSVANETARHSAGLVATALLALVVAGGEVLSAAVVKVLTPAAVTLSQLRLVLPSTIAYNLILCPLVLSVVMLAATMLAQRSAAVGLTRTLAGTKPSRRAAKRAGQLPELHLARNARPAVPHPAVPRQRSRARLRPAAGVPGSATGLRYRRTLSPAPVHIRLAGGRRGGGVLGVGLAGGQPGVAGPGRHPGGLAGRRTFRPHVDRPAVPGQALQRRPTTISFTGRRGDGSLGQPLTAGRPAPARLPTINFAGHRGDGSRGQSLTAGRPARPRPPTISFAGHRGDGSLGQSLAPAGPARARPPRIHFAGHRGDGPLGQARGSGRSTRARPPTIPFAGHRGDGSLGQARGSGRSTRARPRAISFAGHRGDGSLGQTLAPGRPAPWRPRQPAIHFGPHPAVSSSGSRLRMGTRRSAIAPAASPRLSFASHAVPPVQRRAPAAPRFRRGPSGHRSPAIVPGGLLGDSTFRARRQRASPRLRLSRVPPGMLGGSGRSLLARRPGRARKQPRFSYGKRSPLSVLTGSRVGRRLGGKWLVRQRAGGRSGVWLLGRRTGGPR